MKYGIIADVHSNLEALNSVLTVLRDRNVDEYVCAGDIVGYGADPGPCIKMVQETCKVMIAGNHDHAADGLLDTEYFNPEAKEAVLWTAGQLNEGEKNFLKDLSLMDKKEEIFVVHATPVSPDEWNYINSTFDAFRNFKGFEEKICFVGHSHTPVVFTLNVNDNRCTYAFESKIPISEDCRYIINVGSVGQPGDGNPLASCAMYDTSAGEVEIIRVAYDVETAQKKIIDAGLPKGLASRLAVGT